MVATRGSATTRGSSQIYSHNTDMHSEFPYKGYTICIEETREIESLEVTIHGFVPEIGYHTRVIVNDTHIYGLVERGYSRVFDELKIVIDTCFDIRNGCVSMPFRWDYIESPLPIGNYGKYDDKIDEKEYCSIVIGGSV